MTTSVYAQSRQGIGFVCRATWLLRDGRAQLPQSTARCHNLWITKYEVVRYDYRGSTQQRCRYR